MREKKITSYFLPIKSIIAHIDQSSDLSIDLIDKAGQLQQQLAVSQRLLHFLHVQVNKLENKLRLKF